MNTHTARSRGPARLFAIGCGVLSLSSVGLAVGQASASSSPPPTGVGCSAIPADGDGSFIGMADDPAATAASNNPQLSALAAAVDAAGLTDTLNGEGPFTIFAPTNSSFAKVDPDDLEALLADPSGLLFDVLTLHVIPGQQLSSADLAAAGTVDSLAGTLTFASNGGILTVDAGSGPVAVTCADIPTANATIHIVDSVLLPEVAAPMGDAPAADGTALYSVDLGTGASEQIGSLGQQLVGVAIAPDLGNVYGLTDQGELTTFAIDDPSTATTTVITGLGSDAPLIGIDVRPATGDLVGLSSGGVVYTIDPDSATATAVGTGIDPTIEAAALGFDFNPTVDRIRVGVATGQNLRLNPDTGAVGTNPDSGAPTIDGTLAFADGDDNAGTDPYVVGAAYTNSVAGATRTRLYVVDAATGTLAIQDPPNDGVLNTVGPLGVELTDAASFDIAANGETLLAVPANAFGS
jgi:uncharacterized surface protein with fasciclin (FAS1) repeats